MNNDEKEWDDPIVAEVRAIRKAFAKKFKYDLDAIGHYLKQKQKEGEKEGRHYVTRSSKLLQRKHTGTGH